MKRQQTASWRSDDENSMMFFCFMLDRLFKLFLSCLGIACATCQLPAKERIYSCSVLVSKTAKLLRNSASLRIFVDYIFNLFAYVQCVQYLVLNK